MLRIIQVSAQGGNIKIPAAYIVLSGAKSNFRLYKTRKPCFTLVWLKNLCIHSTKWTFSFFLLFYRTMHYSVKCGIAIACRPLRPSVHLTLVDQDYVLEILKAI